MLKPTLIFLVAVVWPAHAQNVGLFESQSDIGILLNPSVVEFNATTGTYTLTSSGNNIGGNEDDFNFLWKKLSGDVAITAEISLPANSGNDHQNGALMIRRTLAADSDHVDAALDLGGIASIRSRDRKGGVTREVQSYISSPRKLRLVKTGNAFFMYLAGEDGVFRLSGGSMQLQLNGQFYIGLAACAHDRHATKPVTFSNVEIKYLPPRPASRSFTPLLNTRHSKPKPVIVGLSGLSEGKSKPPIFRPTAKPSSSPGTATSRDSTPPGSRSQSRSTPAA
jgi:hypothetical protein